MPMIQLTPEILDEKAANLESTAQRNDDVVSRLDSLINALEADWEGEAYNAFRTSYQNKREKFQHFTLDMRDFAKYMRDFAEIMREEEKRQTTAAQNL